MKNANWVLLRLLMKNYLNNSENYPIKSKISKHVKVRVFISNYLCYFDGHQNMILVYNNSFAECLLAHGEQCWDTQF